VTSARRTCARQRAVAARPAPYRRLRCGGSRAFCRRSRLRVGARPSGRRSYVPAAGPGRCCRCCPGRCGRSRFGRTRTDRLVAAVRDDVPGVRGLVATTHGVCPRAATVVGTNLEDRRGVTAVDEAETHGARFMVHLTSDVELVGKRACVAHAGLLIRYRQDARHLGVNVGVRVGVRRSVSRRVRQIHDVRIRRTEVERRAEVAGHRAAPGRDVGLGQVWRTATEARLEEANQRRMIVPVRRLAGMASAR
jgi:hypothetical protein